MISIASDWNTALSHRTTVRNRTGICSICGEKGQDGVRIADIGWDHATQTIEEELSLKYCIKRGEKGEEKG